MTEQTTYTFEALTDNELRALTLDLFRHCNDAFDTMRRLHPHLSGMTIPELRAVPLDVAAAAVRYWDAYFSSMQAQERRGIARYATYSED